MITIFRLDGGEKEGQETSDIKLNKFKKYKELLKKEGKKIISEKKSNHKRFGNVIILEIE